MTKREAVWDMVRAAAVTLRLSAATVSIVIVLLFNALAIAYAAGQIIQRVDNIDKRLQAIERTLFVNPRIPGS